MKPTEALPLVESTLQRMTDLYGATMFDEWAVIRTRPVASVAHYSGPRADGFRDSFSRDFAPLQQETTDRSYAVGDFDFARAAAGTNFDALLRLGPEALLICNNTKLSMAEIRANPQWLKAQVPFLELSEQFRASPLKFE